MSATPTIAPIVGGFRSTASLLGVALSGKVPAAGPNGVDFTVQRAIGPAMDFVGGFLGQGYLIDLTLAGVTNDIDADVAFGSVVPLGIDVQLDLDNTLPRAFTLTGDGDDNVLTGSEDFVNDIFGLGGSDTLTGGDLADFLSGGAGNDTIDGGAGDDQIDGGASDDDIDGGAGDDQILGGGGTDFIEGGEDDDVIDGGNGADEIYGEEGDDHIAGGNGGDLIYGGIGDDKVDGGEGNDKIWGDGGADTLNGGGDNDQIYGGGGGDVIDGGDGNDTMTGQGGEDTFKFAAESDTGSMPGDVISTGNDRINAFQINIDALDFSGLDDVDFIFINRIAANRTVFEFVDDQGGNPDRTVGTLDLRGGGVGNFFDDQPTVENNIAFASGTEVILDGDSFFV